MLSFKLKPLALSDLDQASAWYDAQRRHLGTEFLEEAYAAIDRIREEPARFPRHNQRTRKTSCSRFPYHIYFRIEDDVVVIMAVYHSSRNPERWRLR